MKNTILLLSLALLAGLSTNCGKEDDQPEFDAHLLTAAPWRVSRFFSLDQDRTTEFADYRFTFIADGNLSAEYGESLARGAWQIIDDDGGQRLVIAIGEFAPLRDIWDEWDIVSWKADGIQLVNDGSRRSGQAGEEQLHLSPA